MSLVQVFLSAAGIVFVFMNLMFLWASIKKNNGLVDVGWGIGFVLLAWWSWWQGQPGLVGQIVTAVVTLWGLRLAWHLGRRNIGKAEDWRYANWRKEWGKWVLLRSYFQVFMLQGLFMLLIASPILWVNFSGAGKPHFLLWIGLGIWLFAWLFEAVADAQLKAFVKTKEPGQIMTSGLWAYSRHPNYFGEALQWWGVYLMVCTVPGGVYFVFSPLIITLLIRFVSGVPMLERKYKDNKAFQAYKKKTSVFVPWF